MEPLRVLVVEDDAVIRDMLGVRLRSAGYVVVGVASTRRALKLLCEQRFALLLADLDLGVKESFDLLRQASVMDPELELIIIGNGVTVATLQAALQCGVRGHLQKPIAPGELELHVSLAIGRSRGRREQQQLLQQILQSEPTTARRIAERAAELYAVPAEAPGAQTVGPLQIDERRRQMRAFGTIVPLSHKEFDLLACLARNVNSVVTPERLAQEVLGYSCEQREARDLIKSHIHRMRGKLAQVPYTAELIVSVRGSGYMLAIAN